MNSVKIENQFEINYLNNVVNRDNSKNNLFMDGQLECAKHAQTVIAELTLKLLSLQQAVIEIHDDYLCEMGEAVNNDPLYDKMFKQIKMME